MRHRFTGLWRHSEFLKLWTGQTISVFGSAIGIAAMNFTAILVLHATPFQLGLLAAANLVPGFLVGLFAGAWVDRLPRRPILILADVGRALLLATIPLAAMLGVLRIEQLFVAAFLVSLLGTFFDIAYQSYLPSLIPRADLMEGNSKLSASASVSEVSGFALAGWLVEIVTAPIAILIDAISFGASAVSVWMIRSADKSRDRDATPNMRREIIEGLNALAGQPLLRAAAASWATRALFMGVYGPLVVSYMARDLGFAPGVLGSIWAVGGISSLAGAMATRSAARRLGIGPAMICASILAAIALSLVPFAHGRTLAAALLLILQQLLGDGAMTIYLISQVSLRQSIVPERLIGRVTATAHFLGIGATLVGSLIGGLLGERFGVRTTLFIGAIGILFSTVWLVFSPMRTLRSVPSDAGSL